MTMPIDPETGKRLAGRPTRAERQMQLAAQTRQEARDVTTGISDAILGASPEPPVPDADPGRLVPPHGSGGMVLPGQPTATEQLAELRALRLRMNGPIVKRPAALTVESARKWLAEVAAIGSPGDVEIAWQRINDVYLREKLRNEYDRLRAVAGKRHYQIVEAARAERRAERQAANVRRRDAQLKADIARDEARLAEKRLRLAETARPA